MFFEKGAYEGGLWSGLKNKKAPKLIAWELLLLAEREGFEPSMDG